jgi:hypothetical protein
LLAVKEPLMNTAAALLAHLILLVTRPARDFGRAPTGPALAVPQPLCWAVLRGLVHRVPVPASVARGSLPAAVFLYAAAVRGDVFDRTLVALLPALRAAGLAVPFQDALPVGVLVGVARVVEAVRTSEGWALELDEVQALPMAIDAIVPENAGPIFDVAPGEASFTEAWGVVLGLPAPRSLNAAVAALIAAGYDATFAPTFAEHAVADITAADAREAAIKLELRKPKLAPVRAKTTRPMGRNFARAAGAAAMAAAVAVSPAPLPTTSSQRVADAQNEAPRVPSPVSTELARRVESARGDVQRLRQGMASYGELLDVPLDGLLLYGLAADDSDPLGAILSSILSDVENAARPGEKAPPGSSEAEASSYLHNIARRLEVVLEIRRREQLAQHGAGAGSRA